MKDAVRSGYWPLYRYGPTGSATDQPFVLDSREPSIPLRTFAATEARFAILGRTHPARAERLLTLAQADIDERWHYYQQLAAIERRLPSGSGDEPGDASDAGQPHDKEAE
jgi:pyruvate-ferredoxin/flavodoxin oxidoreductase